METVTNVIVGYPLAVISQWLVFTFFGINVTSDTHLAIAAWFTVLSLVRSYAMRRLFNRWEDHR